MVQLSHRSDSNSLRLTTVFGLLAILPFTLASGVDPRPAIGFDLGQSYGTAVAHLPNGTIVNLAKIEGSPRYRAFMQGELEKGDYLKQYEERTISSLLWEEILILLNRYTGLGPTYGGIILAEMLRSLRVASEATLGGPLPATVVFTAPYMRAWYQQERLLDGLLQRARILAGLKPVTIENMDPVYLGETNTVLAANGRRICPKLRCFGPSIFDEPPWAYETEPLRTDQVQEHASDEESFWRKLEDYLVSQAEEYVTSGDFSGDFSLGKHSIVLVAGEAADNPKFMDAVRQAITRIQNDPIHRYKEAMAGPKVELLVSQDLTYAAAAGVALWRRSMIDSSYCENVARMNKKDHDEL
ncbi:hypothetical protein H0G86_010971 [Trichoderma simmonsii]|uniref:Uncharacterized protein n=1 Tax=Trichoderma simmonsii TaxID=1491479 RepID=A0A8G0LQV0_9HYPO|nr:hypothetical protein H0G86_010971 [Trichoderma simmonsii]